MTETDTKEENENTLAKTSEVDDVSDNYFNDNDDTPPVVVVWRNVILMSLLHMSAVYGLFLIPSASVPTLIFCKY